MYRDVLTMCWSIKEVNKNLADRKALTDYSITYLKNACSELARMMTELSRSRPDAMIEVVDKAGHKSVIAINDVAEMLYDAKKIIELNLIDNIDRWVRAEMKG